MFKVFGLLVSLSAHFPVDRIEETIDFSQKNHIRAVRSGRTQALATAIGRRAGQESACRCGGHPAGLNAPQRDDMIASPSGGISLVRTFSSRRH
jgi:hypothetical protein